MSYACAITGQLSFDLVCSPLVVSKWASLSIIMEFETKRASLGCGSVCSESAEKNSSKLAIVIITSYVISILLIICHKMLNCYKTLQLLVLLVSYIVMTGAMENMFTVEELCEIPDTSDQSFGPLKYPGFDPETCAVHCTSEPECNAFLYSGK